MNESKQIWAGFITYGKATSAYLPFFLESLQNQIGVNLKIVCVDNSETADDNLEILKIHPEIEILSRGQNFGFAKGYNLMISQAANAGAEYFLTLNVDVLLELNTVEKLVAAILQDENISAVCPKLLRWDFLQNKKTNIIDSCGIALLSGLRFVDLGQGVVDNGQYDNATIFGVSGALALYRLSALEKCKDQFGYFDERMFMYKEDCDLAYRLQLAGFKAELVSQAIAYHDRTTSGKGTFWLQVIASRKQKSFRTKLWSAVNQQILIKKHWRALSLIQKAHVLEQELKLLGYTVVFEFKIFRALTKYWLSGDIIK
ncbi:MAG: glycosyltransferase [Candidatus Falkowbacteria bacterium]